MKFKLDENMPSELADELRQLGHDADGVHDEGLAGADDAALTQRVQEENRVLITMDKGIADVRSLPRTGHPGVVLVRLPTAGRQSVLRFVRRYLPQVLRTQLRDRVVIVSPAGIRMR